MFKVDLAVRPRPGVKDPQAEAVQESLSRLGHDRVTVSGVGRLLSLSVDAPSAAEAEKITADLCAELLVNPSLEAYSITIAEEQ